MTTPFAEMTAPRPDPAALQQRYDGLRRAWDQAPDDPARLAVLDDWDGLRRELASWSALTGMRFRCDTTDPTTRAEKELLDELAPRFKQWDAELQLAVLESPHERVVAERHSAYVLDLWRADASTTAPEVAELLVEEGRLCTRYTRLTAGASVDFRGEPHTLAALAAYRDDPDRDLREQAERARWGWFDGQRAALDGLYDELVQLRTEVGRRLGHDDFVPVAYARKRRTDYDRHDVAAFRDQVREQVVPLVAALRERQRRELGLERLMVWDEAVPAGGPSPRPRGDLRAAASELFAGTLPELSKLYERMTAAGLLDLEAREGKAPGGSCTYFPTYGVPFIFANWNGSHDDVRVFTHEMGHAFQRACSSDHDLLDTISCTSETAEIHSMSLEFLTWPGMERFFGDQAEAFRRVHLEQQLAFLPYGCAVDEFQHRVHDEPGLTPDERAGVWLELEARYLPWRDGGDIPALAGGRTWQRQLHVYLYPFYYIDYCLALTCALQLWDQSRRDAPGAWGRFHELCRTGGRLPFRRLTERMGLRSPFAPGALTDGLDAVRQALDLPA